MQYEKIKYICKCYFCTPIDFFLSLFVFFSWLQILRGLSNITGGVVQIDSISDYSGGGNRTMVIFHVINTDTNVVVPSETVQG